MPTPDLTGYVDLAIYDREVADLIDRAVLDLATKLPGWVPREGNTEVVLIEALALEVAELVYAINRVPSAVAMMLLRLFEVTMDDGSPPTATATFTVLTSADAQTVPAGTSLRLDLGGELGPIIFTTDADLTIPAASTSGTVAITGTTNTDEANGVAAGTALDPISSVYFVEAVELATAVADGANPESDADWLDRGMERLARLTTTLVLPEHFTSAALEEADVARATTIDLYDPAVGPTPGDNPGNVTVAVLGDAGAVLSAARRAEIEATLDDLALVNLDVHVVDPTITTVTVTATVHRLAGYTDAEVKTNVVAALDAYLDPEAWEWGGTVYLNELIALLDGVDGVDRVTAVTIGGAAADYTLTGVAPLVDTNTTTANITVTAS